ncbi:MAG: prepilin-type N-terminal cleavage/methylation domain-containing protein [Candidatus Methylomirabilales bacterium]
MSMVYRTHHEAGFTLAGVLVSLVIFMVLGLGMLELTSEVYYRGDLHRENLVATALAQSQVEELLGAGYEDPRLLDPDGGDDVAADGSLGANLFQDPDHADPNNPLNAEGEAAGSRRFTRVWNVGTDVPLPGLKTVTVLVGWRDSRRQPHVVSQTFQIARLR